MFWRCDSFDQDDENFEPFDIEAGYKVSNSVDLHSNLAFDFWSVDSVTALTVDAKYKSEIFFNYSVSDGDELEKSFEDSDYIRSD